MCVGKNKGKGWKGLFDKIPRSIEGQKPPPGPAETAVAGQRIEGPDTQTFVGASGAPGIFGQIATIMGAAITSRQDVTKAGDVAAGRVGKSYGAADLRITRPNVFGGAPTGNPNGPPIPTIPRPVPTTAAVPTTTSAATPVRQPWNLTEAIRQITMAANSPTAARTLFGSRG